MIGELSFKFRLVLHNIYIIIAFHHNVGNTLSSLAVLRYMYVGILSYLIITIHPESIDRS